MSEAAGDTVGGAEVYRRLRTAILTCAMRPGTKFLEGQIAERYNVSKTPVRDALIKLQGQNLVEIMPRKGYRVARISQADAQELYEMRIILERECVSRLIEHGDDALLERLDAFRTLPGGTAVDEWIDYNRGFHIALARDCGNTRLARAAVEVIEQFDRMTHLIATGADPENGPGNLDVAGRLREHCEIVDAVQARDRRRALTLLKTHIDGSRRRLLATLKNVQMTF